MHIIVFFLNLFCKFFLFLYLFKHFDYKEHLKLKYLMFLLSQYFHCGIDLLTMKKKYGFFSEIVLVS